MILLTTTTTTTTTTTIIITQIAIAADNQNHGSLLNDLS